MATKEKLYEMVRDYTDDNLLPTVDLSQVSLLNSGTIFGFIPFTENSPFIVEGTEPLINSLDGDEGEFGENEEYFWGAREYYVRENKKVVSFFQEDKRIGFIIYIVE